MWQPSAEPRSPTSPTSPTSPEPISSRLRNPGKRIGQIVKLKPEHLDEYKACHAKVWPEVLKQLKDCGIQDYSIYYDDKTSLLFASFKYVGYNWTGDMERMAENPKVREWWKMTDSFQESLVPDATSSVAGEPSWWKPVEEVFYMP